MNRFIYFLLIIGLASCASLPKQETSFITKEKITVGDGPEDFQLDSIHNRLLVACDNRRLGYLQGEVWAVDLTTDSARLMEIKFKELSPVFHPHGMSILDGYLFVVSHKSKNVEEFFRFKIYQDSLVQDTIFSEGVIGRGNDILAISKDEFYYSDFKMFGGSIVHYKDGQFENFSKHYKYPNGLIIYKESMYVTTSLSNKLYLVDLASGKKKSLIKLKGGDNLMTDGNLLYTTSHPSMMKFIGHSKSIEKPAPTVVYSFDPKTSELKVLYSNDGTEISAGSTAWIYNGRLYISQVWENFIWIGTLE